MSRPLLDERLFDEMSAFNRKLRALFDMKSRRSGLTLARARTLFALTRRGSLSQKDLAQELDIETPTLVRLLDAMEKQNLIERRAGDLDRRVKEIHVTPEGKEAGRHIQALAGDLRRQITEGITPEDLQVALRVLLALNRNLSDASAQEQDQ
ncbi:MarR family transcriptional regulator [Rhizobium sp. SSA_523]|uniref:MarR family winged helix-turn-helix transcriptional regulator n=1 Tax=Rhizobium sp. SSA_523 TaxID=2952477 RepID=UPI002091E1F7|nr:MarR family transcriptional regulator [Rhizobium sp. SSA_523]MCO5730781.1 MarR family transcriptional regulator [Rhizobium sp. SSA_523]WKC24396.1 MarR family transcriptional regulator [Rhizobium sp. SSA_523]